MRGQAVHIFGLLVQLLLFLEALLGPSLFHILTLLTISNSKLSVFTGEGADFVELDEERSQEFLPYFICHIVQVLNVIRKSCVTF